MGRYGLVQCDYVRKLQARIVKAQKEGRHNKVKALQWMLTHSFYAKALAVKRVTSNKGKNTSGVDKQLWDSPKRKYKAIDELKRRGYKPQPLRRVHIKKKNGNTFGEDDRPEDFPCPHHRGQRKGIGRDESLQWKIPVINEFRDADGNDIMQGEIDRNYSQIKAAVLQIIRRTKWLKNDPDSETPHPAAGGRRRNNDRHLKKGRPLFYFRLQRSSRARWIVQGRAPPWFAEKIILARGLRYFFAKPCAIRHGTERQARNKIPA